MNGQGLVVVDLERLIDGPLDLHRVTLHRQRLDGVLDFPIRTEQSASVNAEPLG